MSSWVKTDFLGEGSYGTVHLAVNPYSKLSPQIAVKSAVWPKASSLMEERRMLGVLRGCPEIIQCYGDGCTVEKGSRVYNLLLEYAPGGTLTDLIIKSHHGGKLGESNIQRYARMILRGLDFIHRKGYVHCDIKPDNILVFPSSYGPILKIADFGLSKKAGEQEIYEDNGKPRFWGTPLYTSRESMVLGIHEAPLDIWSLGCVVIEMFTGKSAWDYKDLDDLIYNICFEKGPKIPCGMSEDGTDFLKKCLERDTEKRWTAKMLLNHPFIVEDRMPSWLSSFKFVFDMSEEESLFWSESMDNLCEEATKLRC